MSYVKPVQIDSEIDILPRIIEVSRKFGKIDVAIYHRNTQTLVAKAMLTAQFIDQA
jgi:predicted transcriptional regulator